MKIGFRYLSLVFCVLFIMPIGAGMDAAFGYNNTTEDFGYNNTTEDFGYGNATGNTGGNATQNASYYFNSGSGSGCTAAGEVKGFGEEISADGLMEGITFLTDSPESELFPVWTADGNYILYTVKGNESGNSESYRMRANGSEIEQTGIGEGNLTGFSDINLNGTELILTKSTSSKSGLYLANMENGTVTPVTDDRNKSESWGAWCRLGHKIVYSQESEGGPSQLWIIDRDGSNKTRLGNSENIGTGKDWCPLGKRIVYSARDSKEKDDLWVIDWYGTNQTQLTNTSYGEWNPSFSPDGGKIVYISDEGGAPEIWIRDIEGNYRARLTNNTGITVESNPKWSPDGLKIVFTANNLQNNLENAITNNSSDTGLINHSINSAIYGSSGSVPNNDSVPSNGSVPNSSDIAVIKLVPAFASSPLPKVTSIKTDSIREISEEGAAIFP